MGKLISSIILFVVGVTVFFVFTFPTHSETQEISQELDAYEKALEDSRRLEDLTNTLLVSYNNLDSEDVDRISKLIPLNIDNVRLIIEIDSIATQYGLGISGINFTEVNEGPGNQQDQEMVLESPTSPALATTQSNVSGASYRTTEMQFTVAASYGNFQSFIRDLEENLRMIDIQAVSMNSSEDSSLVQDYTITFTTYWLGS